MLLRTFFDAIELHRDDKFVSARFLRPFKVISTCPANGGLTGHLDMVFNHQCCEPAGHQMTYLMDAHRRPLQYQAALLADHGLSGKAAGLGTAANMHNLCIAEENYRELALVAVATGGALWQHGHPAYTIGLILAVIPCSAMVYLPYRYFVSMMRTILNCLLFGGILCWVIFRLRENMPDQVIPYNDFIESYT